MPNQSSEGNQRQDQRDQPKPTGTSGRPGDDQTAPSGGNRHLPDDDDEDEDSGLGNRPINR